MKGFEKAQQEYENRLPDEFIECDCDGCEVCDCIADREAYEEAKGEAMYEEWKLRGKV